MLDAVKAKRKSDGIYSQSMMPMMSDNESVLMTLQFYTTGESKQLSMAGTAIKKI